MIVNLKCEKFLGLVLLVIPNRKIKKMANIVLLITKLLNIYSHFAINDLFERMAPTLVFFLLLICRMVVDCQADKSVAAEKVGGEEINVCLTNAHCYRLRL